MKAKPQTQPYPLRISDEMRAALEESAKRAGRSLNAEIAARLEESFAARPTSEGVVAMFEAYKAEVEKAAAIEKDRVSILANAILWCYRELRDLIEFLEKQNASVSPKQQRDLHNTKRVFEHVRSLIGPVVKMVDVTTSYHTQEEIRKTARTPEEVSAWLDKAFPIFKEGEPWPIQFRRHFDEKGSLKEDPSSGDPT